MNSPVMKLNEEAMAKSHKFRAMTPDEYSEQLGDLIEYAGIMLNEDDARQVQMKAFNLLYTRLGVRIQSSMVIP